MPMREFFVVAASRGIVRNALQVSAVVGTILNVINQGEIIWQGEPPLWPHLVMNYLVPYCVATYSAARQELRRRLVVGAEAIPATPSEPPAV